MYGFADRHLATWLFLHSLLVGREGVAPPVFSAWVAGLQPAALAAKRPTLITLLAPFLLKLTHIKAERLVGPLSMLSLLCCYFVKTLAKRLLP